MDLKRLGLASSVGIGIIAVFLLLVLLNRPGVVASGRLVLSQAGAEAGTAFPVTDAAPVHYVTITGTDSGDCSTPAGACRTIQYAVDVAGDGGLIKIATGVYTDVHSRHGITQAVYISKSVSLEGGYTPAFDTRPDPIAFPTTLDAQGRGRVVHIAGDITVSLTSLHITGGDATGDYRWPNRGTGGGIYAMHATVTISASRVYSNTGSQAATARGGGLAFEKCAVTLVDNDIRANTGCSGLAGVAHSGVGGGLFISGGEFDIAGNQILSNTALIDGGLTFGGSGGGIAIDDSSGQFVNNLVGGNVAAFGGDGNGGGMILRAGPGDRVTLRGNTVRNNVASSSDGNGYVGYGGGMYIFATAGSAEPQTDVRVSNNILLGNIAAATGLGIGGGLYAWGEFGSATLALNNNQALGNTATFPCLSCGIGGGLVIQAMPAELEGNALFGNSAGSGSALVFEDSTVKASNLVVADNHATNEGTAILVRSSSVALVHSTLARNIGGSGIHLERPAPSQVAIVNTILVSHAVGITVAQGSTATLEGILWYRNAINTGGEGSITVTRAYTGDPAFDTDGYHLLRASAAVDTGLDAGVDHDIDGEPRPVDGDGDGVAEFDIGADEYTAGGFHLYLPALLRH